MPYFILEYDFVDGYVEKRQPYRTEHLQQVQEAHERGEVVMAGALADDSNRGLLVWFVDDPGVAERFAASDAYVTNGIVQRWAVRPWNVVVGGSPSS